MSKFAGRADVLAIEAEGPWAGRDRPLTIHQLLARTAERFGDRPGISFQLTSGPKDAAETLTWREVCERSVQAANLFRSLGIGPGDVVAFVMPNAVETVTTLLGGAMAGIVNPVNPLLEPERMASILRGTGAKVVVTLRSFPKSDVAQKVSAAVALAPGVETVLEVDLRRYLSPPKSWIVSVIRPRSKVTHRARVLDFNVECARQPKDRLTFSDGVEDRVAAYFHTGGTTGMPKVAQHRVSGMVYNGWLGARLLFADHDVGLCPLPLFHVFAAYPVLMSFLTAGGHLVFPTPAGYRGEGVFDNLWTLIARWQASYLFTVPTALAALMQRKVNADVSSLRGAFSGSAPLSVDLYKRFEAATGVAIIEGYGLTECTCLVAVNPAEGKKKIGSVGLAVPFSEVRIVADGEDAAADGVGEICVASPGVVPGATYTEGGRNRDLYVDERFVRTGDLGRIDAEGYLFITGRAKDLIIRGGHNIDPALIEDALMAVEGVSVVGAIGQPDAHSGEVPCAYVELDPGSSLAVADLLAQAKARIGEPAAIPRHIEILADIPKTAIGKVFKPDLRRKAITRVFDATLEAAGLPSRVKAVREDKARGLVAVISRTGGVDEARVKEALDGFLVPWDWD